MPGGWLGITRITVVIVVIPTIMSQMVGVFPTISTNNSNSLSQKDRAK